MSLVNCSMTDVGKFLLGVYSVGSSGFDCKSNVFGLWRCDSFCSHIMTERLITVLKYISKEYGDIQVYPILNYVGDRLELDYEYEGILVYFCPGYYYIDLSNLTQEEIEAVDNIATIEHHVLRTDYINSLD